MPREKASFLGIISGDEPGLFARIRHSLSGDSEGSWGEQCIEKLLRNRVSDMSLFSNVYVPIKGRTAELDIVMVHQTGIYIFESKAYGGKIYGHSDRINWVQYIGNTHNSFYNPILQNENHRLNLAQVLKVPKNTIFSFVVFENRADLSKITPLEDNGFIVCNRERLLWELERVITSRDTLLSIKEREIICKKLNEWSDVDSSVRLQHIQQVRIRMFSMVCPVCGRNLIERHGSYGRFLGCAGYPKCRYTRKI